MAATQAQLSEFLLDVANAARVLQSFREKWQEMDKLWNGVDNFSAQLTDEFLASQSSILQGVSAANIADIMYLLATVNPIATDKLAAIAKAAKFAVIAALPPQL